MTHPSKLTKEDKRQLAIARFERPEELKKWKPKARKFIHIPIDRTYLGMLQKEKPTTR